MVRAEREIKQTKLSRQKKVSDVEHLSQEELAFQLVNVSNYAHQVAEENREMRNKLTTIHNRIIEMWKYDFYIDPEISRNIANQYHINFDNKAFRSKLDDTVEVINGLTKTRRAMISDEEVYENLEKAQREVAQMKEIVAEEKEKQTRHQELMDIKNREIERLKEALKVEKEKKVPVPVKSQGVKIIVKTSTSAEKAVHIEPIKEEKSYKKEIKEFPMEKKQEKIELEEEILLEKAENLAIFSLLEKYDPKPPSNPIYDCDIEYEGKLAAVYCVKEKLQNETVFEEIAKTTTRIFFVGDDEKFYNKEVSHKFLTWMIKTGRANEVEHSFTLQEKLAETKELKKLRKL